MAIPRPTRLALFDFDGTLCRINSYHVFLRWGISQRDFYSARLALALLLRQFRFLSSRRVKNLALGRLRSMSRRDVEALGQTLYAAEIKPHLRKEGLAEIGRRTREGYRVLILSGGFDFLLSPFAAEHQLDHLHCARLAYRGDVCLGCLEGGEMRGLGKLEFLQQHVALEQIDWPASCAYSDELSDLPILQAVGQPFLVAKDHSAPHLVPEIQRVIWK